MTANFLIGNLLAVRSSFLVFKEASWVVRALRMARVFLGLRSKGMYFLFCKIRQHKLVTNRDDGNYAIIKSK